MGSSLDNVSAVGGMKEHRSWIAYDLEKHEQCKVDDMLSYFLGKCLVGPNAAPKDAGLSVLQLCLEAVLPICNSEDMKQSLVNYCTSKPDETSRQVLFVDLSNDVLKNLRAIDIAGTRRANEDLNILFCRSDRACIEADRGAQVSRSPGVVLVSLAAAQAVAPGGRKGMQWDDVVAGYACDGASRRKTFAWSSILALIELKACETISNPPPAAYGGLGQVIPANTVHSGCRPTKMLAERLETLSVPAIQCGLYGVAMLLRRPCVTHAINLLLIDDVIWIWWYDRQGAIQTEGINFVQDLPRFLVLLFAFQRFELDNWGFNISLYQRPYAIHSSDLASRGIAIDCTRYIELLALGASGESARITIDTSWQVYQVYGLAGRGTSVFCGTATLAASERSGKVASSGNSSMACGATGVSKPSTELREVTVKIYWQEESRSNEAEGPREASTMGIKMDTLGHHPGPLFARDVPECSTWFIRKKLGLERAEDRGPARFLRLAVFLRPRRVTALVGAAFMKAWLDCVRGHYALWELGIEDVKPRLSTLMADGGERGFLIDWELATMFGQSSHDGTSRLETVPFTALDLLDEEYWAGKMKRQYHHDLEGFLWILPYVFLQYENGKMIKNPLKSWNTGKYVLCREKKQAFLANLRTDLTQIPDATSSYEWEWLVFLRFVQRIDNNWRSPLTDAIAAATKKKKAGLATSVPRFLKPGDVYSEFWDKIKMAAEDDSGRLLYLKECVPDGF